MVLASPTLLIEQSPGDESRLHKLAEGHRASFLDNTISRIIEVSSCSAKTLFRLGQSQAPSRRVSPFSAAGFWNLRLLPDVIVYGSSL